MALTKIGATLGGSADVITVTQNNHGLLVGRPVRMTSNGYAYATANTAPNAEAIGIIIAVTTNTLTIALGGRVTVDDCVPSGDPGTVLFLQPTHGLLHADEPSEAGQISKPMAVITVDGSEMVMVQQRGEVISTGGASIADGSITLAKMAVNSIDSDQYVDGSIDLAHMSANSIDSDQYVDGSIDEAHIATDAVRARALASDSVGGSQLASGVVNEAHMSISNPGTDGQFLQKQSGNTAALTWADAGGIPSGVILMWSGLIANIPSGWVLCNGQNSTPDLRGRFIQGAPDGNEANDPTPGGSATATPANHSVTQPSNHAALANHQHSVAIGNWGNGSLGTSYSGWGNGGSFTIHRRSLYQFVSRNDGGTASLVKEAAAGTPDSHRGTAVSAHSTADSRPPFYTLLYIMKT